MNEKHKKVTIKDVAQLAGVSKGTVDRVIHKRGEVSQDSLRKVLAVIEQIDYKPNIYASLLSSKRRYRCMCLIPDFAAGEFWEIAYLGLERAARECRDFNMEVECVRYDQFDAESFHKASLKILDDRPDAVLIAPMFLAPTKALAAELRRRSIPFVYVDSKVEQSGYAAYYGVPTFQSGYLGASLLLKNTTARSVGCFRIRRAGDASSNTATMRQEGFRSYLDKYMPACKVHSTFLHPHDRARNMLVLDRFFMQNPDVLHIIAFNSRAYVIAAYLAERGIRDKVLLGYDPLEDNVRYMKDGYIEFIIAQRSESQAYRGVMALCDIVVFKKAPAVQDNYMPMDILTKENADYYIDLPND